MSPYTSAKRQAGFWGCLQTCQEHPILSRMADQTDKFNISSYLPMIAQRMGNQRAVIVAVPQTRKQTARYRGATFSQLESLSNQYANGLQRIGIRRGMRTLLMVQPGIEFTGLVFALFKIGAIPVLIDSGMGVKNMLQCVRTSQADAMIAVPTAQLLRRLRPKDFQTIRSAVTVGRSWFGTGPNLEEVAKGASSEFTPVETSRNETAAILFTSGSTGPAKGVVYEHGMFDGQIRILREHYEYEPGEVELATFPLFALFCPALGITCVFPEMDFSRPGNADPEKIIRALLETRATSAFGSPALWRRVAEYCSQNDIKLWNLRRILVAGAPVPFSLVEQMRTTLNINADVHTPYGATEALPVASIKGAELLSDCVARTRVGAGICVGVPLPNVIVRIIRITDDPIPYWMDDLELPQGRIGEIAVSGDVVTQSYWGLAEATKSSKIKLGDRTWHRMGDVGYFDTKGRLWFCGRKSQRVETQEGPMFTIRCESVFNEHPDVNRSALVGVGERGRQKPVVIVEPKGPGYPPAARLATLTKELLQKAHENPLTEKIDKILFHRSFPVDVRHNAKINREKLAEWARRRVR